MSKIVCCTVGTLMGDAWMSLPALVARCREHEIRLVCGTYALPVWEWGKKHVVGADYEIIRTIPDPDEVEAEFCPGKGFLSMSKALDMVRAEMPGETVWGHQEIGSYYGYADKKPDWFLETGRGWYEGGRLPPLELRDVDVCDGEAVIVHPYTRHDWKNLNLIIGRVNFSRPVKIVGLPGEFTPPAGWESIADAGFDAMVAAVLGSAGMVGILSSFTNLAAIFNKRQIIVSFTPDIPILNPRAVKLVTPSLGELEAACRTIGWA